MSDADKTTEGASFQDIELDSSSEIERDSVYDDSDFSTGPSSRRSLASSLDSFTYANGRRYHSDRFRSADYFLPNDEVEQERLDLYHHVFLSLLGGNLTTVPLENKKLDLVLDLGTGTGIWAIDFAREHPECSVIGTDLSPIQPGWVPPNVKFEVADMEDPWIPFFKPNSFDYVHMRTLSGAIKDWDALLEETMVFLKPGGYVEFQDYGCRLHHCSGQLPEGSRFGTYMSLCQEAGIKAERDLTVAHDMRERFIRLGFEDVHEQIFVWPVGPWPRDRHLKELGRLGHLCISESLDPFCLDLLTRRVGWDQQRTAALCDEVREEIRRVKGYYFEMFFIYGRKPL